MSKIISVRVPDNLRIALEMKSKSEGVSMNQLVKNSLELSLKTDEIEIMKTAHEKHITAIEKVAEQSFDKTRMIDNYLNLTEQRVKRWDTIFKKGIPKYSLIGVIICSVISAISSTYLVFSVGH
jgi:uncharacterized membrane protein YukC